MWIRIGSFLAKPEQASELSTVYNQQAIPKVRTAPGNLACLLLEPQTPNEQYIAMTVWESRDAAAAYEASGTAAEVITLVRDFFAGPPTLRTYASDSLHGLTRDPESES